MGIPQGSCLGPVLFLLYINDMYKSATNLNMVHFADDTTLYQSGSNINNLINKFNSDLCSLDEWLCANRLSLNIEKTKFFIISNKKYEILDSLKIRNVCIKQVTSTKFIGINFDCKLKFDLHINDVLVKLPE